MVFLLYKGLFETVLSEIKISSFLILLINGGWGLVILLSIAQDLKPPRYTNLINNVFNNILFLFVSVTIDIYIIRFTNEKYTRSKSLFHDQKHLDEAAEHRKKVRILMLPPKSAKAAEVHHETQKRKKIH